MSKKHLKARCSYPVTTYHEKPLSVVGPLKIKNICGGFKGHEEEQSEKSQVPLEGSAWEYKPRSSSALSGPPRQSGFRSIFNGSPPPLPPSQPCMQQLTSTPVPIQLSSESSLSISRVDPSSSSQIILLNPKSENLNQERPGAQPSTSSLIVTLNAPVSNQQSILQALPKEPLQLFKNKQPVSTVPSSAESPIKSTSSKVPSKSAQKRTSDKKNKASSPSRKRKREDNLLPENCKFSRYEIVDTPKDTFSKLLEKLPTDDRMIFKDTRRKGKNREAARRARDRRIRQHEQLIKQKDIALKEQTSKKQELKKLEDECNAWGKLVDTLNHHVRVLESKMK